MSVLAVAPLGLSACGGDEGTTTVLAAASLSEVLPQVADLVEEEEGGAVEISYAASSAIVAQVNEGVDADLVVLAGEEPLDTLDDDLVAGDPVIVATNTMAIAVPPDNPADIQGLEDLARGDITLVVCAEQVPCGAAAVKVFEQAGITPAIASFEPDVTTTLSKTISGEADAALVYVTDVTAADDQVGSIDLPQDVDVVNRYPAVVLADSEAGRGFVDALLSSAGQEILGQAGFGSP